MRAEGSAGEPGRGEALRPRSPRCAAAVNLAVFRIVAGLVLLTSRDLRAALAVATLPAALRSSPERLGLWLAALPVSSAWVHAAVVTCQVAAALTALGLWTRPALVVATLTALYALGVAQLGGAVWHCHHLVWFCALLAVSPCGDALSVDSWLRARRPAALRPAAPAELGYLVPLWLAWALVGVIFFFPGVWKLRTAGLAWIFSDNLRNQMYWKWLQLGGQVPRLRLDRVGWLCRLLAGSVVALELLFPVLLWFRRLRPVAVAGALLFHLGAWVYLGIDFSSLWPFYVIFFDWSGLVGGRGREPGGPGRSGALWPQLLVGSGLLAGSIWYGYRGQMTGWPFACYPTFQWPAGPTMPALLVEAQGAQGEPIELLRPWQLGAAAGPRAFALSWSVIGVGLDRQPPAPARLRAYWEYLRTQDAVAAVAARACTVRFYRATLAVAPELWSAPPRTRALLYTLTLPCRSPEPAPGGKGSGGDADPALGKRL